MTLDPAIATISDLVTLRPSFMPHIDIDQAHDPEYRQRCVDAYVYLPEDETLFKTLTRALTDDLAMRRHVIFEVGPFGVGKTLLDLIRGHLFGAPDDDNLLSKLPKQAFWFERVKLLTADGPYLVVYLGGLRALDDVESELRAAIDQALPDDLVLDSEYEHSLAWIADLSERGGESLHDFSAAVSEAKAPHGGGETWSLPTLTAALAARRSSALTTFHHAQERAFRWPPASRGAARAVDLLEEVRSTHVGPGRRFGGILLVFDEFSQWATALGGAEAQAAVANLQSVVEWVNRSPRVAMVISSQVRPTLGAAHDQLETLLSRTHDIAFARSSYSGFLGAVLERTRTNFDEVDSSPDWARLTALHAQLFGPEGASHAVRSYYPFHPAAVSALTALADQLGAHERSVAAMLATSAEEAGFGAFLEEPILEADGATLRLFTIDRLFPYFETRLGEDWPLVYERYRESLPDGPAHPNGIRLRLLHAFVLLEILGAAPPIPPTVDGLAELLNVSPEDAGLKAEVKALVDDGIIQDAGAGRYQLRSGGRLSKAHVEQELARRQRALAEASSGGTGDVAVRRIRESLTLAWPIRNARKVDVWPSPIAAEVILAPGFAERHRLPFEFDVLLRTSVVGIDREVKTTRPIGEPPRIVILIATDGDTALLDLHAARAAARRATAADITVGIPRAPLALADALRQVAATEELVADQAFADDPLPRQILLERQEMLLRTLAQETAIAAFDWFTPGADTEAGPLAAEAMAQVADRAAFELAPSTPTGIHTEQPTKVVKDVVSRLLVGRSISLYRDRSRSRAQQIISEILIPIGLVAARPSTLEPVTYADVIPPDRDLHEESRAIWDELERAVNGQVSLASAIATLSVSPFWIARHLGVYFLAAVLGYQQCNVLQDGAVMSREADLVGRMWKDPVRFSFAPATSGELPAEEAQFIREVARLVGATSGANGVLFDGQFPLDAQRLRLLRDGIEGWHAGPGQVAGRLATDDGFAWPPALAVWLLFVGEAAAEPGSLDGGSLKRRLAVPLGEVAGDLPTSLTMLQQQSRRLRALLDDAALLDQARARIETPAIHDAWQVVVSDPLNEQARRALRDVVSRSRRPGGTDTNADPDGTENVPGDAGTREQPSPALSRSVARADVERLMAVLASILEEVDEPTPMTGQELMARLITALEQAAGDR